MSMLRQLVESRERPIVTAEFPAVDAGSLETVAALLEPIAPHVDAINATDNPAAHAHASNVAIAVALQTLGAEPILQVVCRDKNRLAAQADIMGAALFGVRNVCALTGDDVTAGDEPEARRVFDLDGPQLVKVASGLAEGHYLSGRAIADAPDLFIGAVENPFAPPIDYRVQRALIKSEAGARFLQLQIGYHPDRLESFVRGCVENGVAARTALLPTICLTRTARALSFMNDKVPGISVPTELQQRVAAASDVAEESYQVSLELARHALSLPGVAGIHVADFRHDGSLGRLVSDLQLRTATSSAACPRPTRHPRRPMHTVVRSATKQVTIGHDQPFCIIGERINPTGRKKFQEQLRAGDLSAVEIDVHAQVAGGATMLDVNMGAPLVDEADMLAKSILLIQSLTDLPLCIDSSVVEALEAGLAVYQGKALVNSITAEDERMEQILPLVKKHGAAIIALPNDEEEIPDDPHKRLELVDKIVEVATKEYGIPLEDLVIDPLAMPIGADSTLVWKTLETIRLIRDKYGLNMTLGASNVSFGMPDRHTINAVFLPMAMTVGLTSAIQDCRTESIVRAVRGADLMMGNDEWGASWIAAHRAREAAASS